MGKPSLPSTIEVMVAPRPAIKVATRLTRDFFIRVKKILDDAGLPITDQTINMAAELLLRYQTDSINSMDAITNHLKKTAEENSQEISVTNEGN